MAAFASIGHSSRSLDEFLSMLRAAGIGLLADVRAFPRSRSNPGFNIERLPLDLARVQIGYRHLPALGGRRPGQKDIAPEVNGFWRVSAFHNYADYALGAEFAAGFTDLLALGQGQRVALMCAEALWWRCHRRIICDYLLMQGHAVTHLLAPGQTEAARPTPGARLTQAGKVVYPAPDSASARESR